MTVDSFSIKLEPVSLVSLLMAVRIASFLVGGSSLLHALKAAFDRRLGRGELHHVAERTVELAADAHKHLERDELIFRELGERVELMPTSRANSVLFKPLSMRSLKRLL